VSGRMTGLWQVSVAGPVVEQFRRLDLQYVENGRVGRLAIMARHSCSRRQGHPALTERRYTEVARSAGTSSSACVIVGLAYGDALARANRYTSPDPGLREKE